MTNIPDNELRAEIEKRIIFMRKFNEIGNKGWNDALDEIMSKFQSKLQQVEADSRMDELKRATARTKPHLALYLPQPYKQPAVAAEYLDNRIKDLKGIGGQ